MSDGSISDLELAMYNRLVAGKPQIKVVMLIARTFEADALPADDCIDAALERLAARHDIETFGLIKRWRHSEIRRLPTTPG